MKELLMMSKLIWNEWILATGLDYGTVVLSTVLVAVLGLLLGVALSYAGKKLHVPVDARESQIREALPGNNCGGCGYAGCDALAKAIAAGLAPVGACPVGGSVTAQRIGEIMGVEAEPSSPQVAFVACGGTCDATRTKYTYVGVEDCVAASVVPGGGDKMCSSGCLGFGSCVRACPFDAIIIEAGVAKVMKDKCRACGNCVAVCPKQLISLIPKDQLVRVKCSSPERGKAVIQACDTGCRGCTLCAKLCPEGAITMEGNLPVVNAEVCKGCLVCVEKCPAHTIVKKEL